MSEERQLLTSAALALETLFDRVLHNTDTGCAAWDDLNCSDLVDRIEALLESAERPAVDEVARLREALSFYACTTPCETCAWEDDDVVCGERARKALAFPDPSDAVGADFWPWIRTAYRAADTSTFTVWNMEVAFRAGERAGRMAASDRVARVAEHLRNAEEA